MGAHRSNAGKVHAVLACLALCWALSAAPAAAEPPPGQAGWLYDPGKVVAIDLTLSPQAISELEAEPDEYVKGGFALSTTDGTPGGEEVPVGSPLADVGIRLKGGANGSFRKLTGKAAFKLKFNKFVKGQKFEGLKKMTLNNMLEDPSLIHETLTYDAFRAAGVPASRTGYADVRVNGDDFGVYLNIETLDDVALERWFGPKSIQHLYEGEDGSDVTPGVDELPAGEGGFEVDEGDEGNLEDLKALVAAANSTEGPGWSDAVAPVADLAEMTRNWAIEKYSGHWDAYAGQEGEFLPNNFYLFSGPSGVFQMLPWGTDETWERRLAFDGPAGLLFNRCLADPACDALYRQELRSVGRAIAKLHLDSLALDTAALLEPWEQQEQANSRHEHDLAEIQNAVEKAHDFIADRPGELAAFLGPEESSGPSPAPAGEGRAASPPRATLYVGHSRREGSALVTHMRLPGPGRVSQTATFETPAGRRRPARHECLSRLPAPGSCAAHSPPLPCLACASTLSSSECKRASIRGTAAKNRHRVESTWHAIDKPVLASRGENSGRGRLSRNMCDQLDQTYRRIANVAARQHGVVTVEQLRRIGLDKHAVRARVRTGRLFALHRGVYAVGYPGRSHESRWMAAVLACGPAAALSHASAAALWRFLPPPAGPVDVATPSRSGRAARRGIRLHRFESLAPDQITRRMGIPVTTPARTIADLSGTLPAWQWRRAVRQAEISGLALGCGFTTDRTRSDVERDFLRLCRRYEIPPPEVNVRVGRWTVDFVWSRQRLAVETDSYRYHRGTVTFEDDHARDLDLRQRGLEVRRFTARQIREESSLVAGDLREALGLAS